uniref:EndoU domain-containing protein n=1 Tax=Histophilus somni TaxID=731 RepID=UPI000A67F85A
NSKGSQAGISVDVSFGNAWSVSGFASGEKGKNSYKQVNEQAGLIAGKGGYHIEVNNVHLKGGTIASTTPNNSELRTNRLTFNDIRNKSSHKATSVSISGTYGKGAENAVLVEGKTAPNITHSLPMHSQSNDSSITKTTITEGEITLNKDTNPIQTTAKALGINTELDKANKQVEAPKDINKVLKEQQILSQEAGNVAGAVMTYASRQAAELEEKAKQAEQEATKAAEEGDLVTATQKAQEATAYQQAAKEWQTGGNKKQAATAVAAALSLIVAGKPTEAVVAGAVSPYVNEAIKKVTDSPELQALNIPAHILWGVMEAQLSSSSATAGAVATGVGEVGAKILSETVYGKSPTELTEMEKQELIQVIKGIAGVAGGVAAGSDTAAGTLATVSTGMRVAENAVEFNFLGDDIHPSEERKQSIEMFAKTLFKDKENAEELAEAYYDAMKIGEAKAVVEGVQGTVDGIVNLDKTVATLANVIQNPKETFDKVVISAEQWNEQLNWALENDSMLAAEMQGYMLSLGKSLEAPSILLTGEAINVFQKVVTKNVSNLITARENMVSLVSSQRAEHILYGDKTGGGHKFSFTNILNGKSKFPIHWSEKKILDVISNIATDPNLEWVQQTGTKGSLYTKKGVPSRFKVEGVVDGVRIRVIVEPMGNGVITAFPIKQE